MKVKPNLTELSVAIRLRTDRRNNGNLHILWGKHQEYENSTKFTHFVGTNIKNMKIVQNKYEGKA